MDVGAAVRGAVPAWAVFDEWPLVGGELDRRTSNRNRFSASGARAIPCRARRVGTAQSGAVQLVSPLDQVVGLADPEQVARRPSRWGMVIPSTPRISCLSRPKVPPIDSPSTDADETRSAAARRRSSCTPP